MSSIGSLVSGAANTALKQLQILGGSRSAGSAQGPHHHGLHKSDQSGGAQGAAQGAAQPGSLTGGSRAGSLDILA